MWGLACGFVVSGDRFWQGSRPLEEPKTDLVELAEGQGHFVEASIYFAENRVGLVFSGGEALAGVAAGEDFDALLYRGNGIEVELALGHGFDHFFTQHQVVYIFRRNQYALISGEAFHFADVVEPLDFLVYTADGLDISLLIHRASDGEFLADGVARKSGEQRINFGGTGAIAVHARIGLFEAEAGGKREGLILREGAAHIAGNDVHAFIVEAAAEV